MRTHVILPDDLIEKVDDLVGPRRRSHFIEEALREKLKRDALLAAIRETSGVLTAENQPEWATTRKAAAWVRRVRRRATRRPQILRGG